MRKLTKKELPVMYHDTPPKERRLVREEYVWRQGGKCWYCNGSLHMPPPAHIMSKKINRRLFPSNFFKHPVHLQHDHDTGLTEGAVHAVCNAVLWQYEGR